MADDMTTAINAKLWDSKSNDHYITQLNPDGTKRDFIDYDSNLIAVAHQIPNTTRAANVFKRVDSGHCSSASGGGSQWVSEIWYGRKDTTGGNIGDSACAMARIGWFDALARRWVDRSEDLQYFNSRIINPLVKDVNAFTWLYERYGCDGKQQTNRTAEYFEYPCVRTFNQIVF